MRALAWRGPSSANLHGLRAVDLFCGIGGLSYGLRCRDLPPLESGEAHPSDSAHVTLPLSPLNQRRILQSKPGGSWKDWDEDL